jgi:hypothetical protein
VTLAERTTSGPVPREDIAAILLALLDKLRLDDRTVEVIGSAPSIADTAAAALAAR